MCCFDVLLSLRCFLSFFGILPFLAFWHEKTAEADAGRLIRGIITDGFGFLAVVNSKLSLFYIMVRILSIAVFHTGWKSGREVGN